MHALSYEAFRFFLNSLFYFIALFRDVLYGVLKIKNPIYYGEALF